MKQNLNIENFIDRSIVPVYCSNKRGTAFWIDDHRLITALHVVSDSVVDRNIDSKIYIDGSAYICNVIQLGETDICLLECLDIPSDIKSLPLLSAKIEPEQHLKVIGFPEEIGNGIDIFEVGICNVKEITNKVAGFNVIARRTDCFAFHSYAGFSGSPVLNNFFHVVGVVTDQYFNSLGYASISTVKDELTSNKVPYKDNDEEQDTTVFGLGTAILLMGKSIERAGSRYVPSLHVPYDSIEKTICNFCYVGFQDRINMYEIKIKEYKSILPKKYFDVFNEDINVGIRNNLLLSSDFVDELNALYNKTKGERDNDYLLPDNLRHKMGCLVDEGNNILSAQNFALHGGTFVSILSPAGYGKTHILCHLAETMCHETNVYLYYGTDFSASENPLNTIQRINGWDGDDVFDRLNEKMQQKNRYAISLVSLNIC